MLAALKRPATVRRALRMKSRRPLRALQTPFRYLYNKTTLPLRSFQPKYPIFCSSENFILKTADTPFELRQVLKLRHDIFYKELQNKEAADQLDIDEFDFICDHLIIIDKKNSKVVGTYRVISSIFSDRFYSAGEFEMGELLKAPGNKLELGRACIHKDYRNGAIITLLWRGIVEYIKATDSKFLFGCASVQTVDPAVAGSILGHLQSQGLSSNEYNVKPTLKYRSTLEISTPEVEPEIPALIQSYIKAGAKFYGEPALDRDFDCYDFFMVLKIDEMSRLFRRRFGLDK